MSLAVSEAHTVNQKLADEITNDLILEGFFYNVCRTQQWWMCEYDQKKKEWKTRKLEET